MTFEEWLETRPYVDIDDFLRDAWEAAFEEGYKFANKENEEYDKTLTGDSAV
jgi:hypothetical protein